MPGVHSYIDRDPVSINRTKFWRINKRYLFFKFGTCQIVSHTFDPSTVWVWGQPDMHTELWTGLPSKTLGGGSLCVWCVHNLCLERVFHWPVASGNSRLPGRQGPSICLSLLPTGMCCHHVWSFNVSSGIEVRSSCCGTGTLLDHLSSFPTPFSDTKTTYLMLAFNSGSQGWPLTSGLSARVTSMCHCAYFLRC